ncbi:MAG: tetratricopeptide repeat protein [Desulfosarcina sp.]|nr:tetratricopeptide repeat protein [Desulfobacterales bacterium]
MDLLETDFAQNIFAALNSQPAQLENLSNNALSNGIDLYTKGDYKGAVKEFKRSIGLAPTSEYSSAASNYMANAYLKLDDMDQAIKTYKAAIKLNPLDDVSHIKLGNLYYSEEKYEEAEHEYGDAVKINPDAVNYYSLGQAHLATGRLGDAENVFNKVKNLAPDNTNGAYGLGLVRSKQGRFDDAVTFFEEAIRKKKDFYDAYAEIGYAYADMGLMDDAQEMVDFLENKDSGLADTLSRYMYKVDPPRIEFPFFSSTFGYKMPRNTSVSALDSYLEAPGTSKSFTMEFVFSKEMDKVSVENKFNWSINRSTQTGPGQAYNFGMPVNSTDVNISLLPNNIFYDEESLTAVVSFTIKQNEAGDGTIDPSHIEFKFSGNDSFGLKMDPEGDQFTGFSGVV